MKKIKSLSFAYCFFIGLIIAAIFKIFVIEILTVDGNSMNPTLKDGQNIYVNKLSYGIQNPFTAKLFFQWNSPQENDIIVYFHNNNLVVKRCVAIENSTLDYLTNSKYILLVNLDKQIPLSEEQYSNLKKCLSVPKGYILAVGDNYDFSLDSRNYGFIPVSNVLGKVICR